MWSLLYIFLFLCLCAAIYGLQADYGPDSRSAHLVSLLGVVAAVQWISILAMPLIQVS